MMATSLAENGAHRVYIIGRRIGPLNELEAKHPGYHIPYLPSTNAGLHSRDIIVNERNIRLSR